METVKGGKPYIMFGDGNLAACKPISEADLASYIADCVQGEDLVNKILPIGGAPPLDTPGLRRLLPACRAVPISTGTRGHGALPGASCVSRQAGRRSVSDSGSRCEGEASHPPPLRTTTTTPLPCLVPGSPPKGRRFGAGPGKAYTAKEQAEILFRVTGKEPKYFGVPVALMDFIIGLLDLIGKVIPPVGVRPRRRPSARRTLLHPLLEQSHLICPEHASSRC